MSRPRDYASKREAAADGGVTSARDLAGVDIVVERGVKYKGQANDRRPSAPVSNLRRSPASAVAAVLTLLLTSYSTFEVWRDRAGSLAAIAGTN